MHTSQRGLFLSLSIFFFLTPAYALELGDESDGTCLWDGVNPIEIRLWQCTSLDVTGVITFVDNIDNQTGVDVLDIRVQQNVTIGDVLDLSATAGGEGFGGYPGGNSASGADGLDGQGPSNSRGLGGAAALSDGFSECSGAGGSGGRLGGTNPPLKGDDTGNLSGNCAPKPALGGAAPSENSASPTQLSGSIRGGPGGGAGGGADDTFTTIAGGDGGGGGGVIRIYSGGTIELGANADIYVNGSDGGPGGNLNTEARSGGGGGGAGGVIYLASLTDINITLGADLQASGGNGGTATSPGGAGSNGGAGIIRLEDDDGIINGAAAASTPSVSTGIVPSSASGTLTTLSSDISPGCALRSYDQEYISLTPWILLGFSFLIFLGQGIFRTFKIKRASF